MATGTAAKTIKGFKVICPFCGDAESTVKIDLNDLNSCTCSSCDEEFTPRAAVERAAEQLRRWEGVARWVESAVGALSCTD